MQTRPPPQTTPSPRAPALAAVLLAALAMSASPAGRADCTCICVDGLNRPLCSEVTDIEPLCPPRVCPQSPAAETRQPYRLPPFDAPDCAMKYVYNKYAERYEWRQVCR